MKKLSRLSKYLIMTFAISWISWGALILLIKSGVTTYANPLGLGVFLLGGFGPTVAAITVQEKLTLKSLAEFVFGGNHREFLYFLLFCFLLIAVIGLSSRTLKPDMPLYLLPLNMLVMTTIGGGNEELGWRGVMQPTLEKSIPFPAAVALTSITWSIWHLPLWLVDGSSQQAISFVEFAAFDIVLSSALAVIYGKTRCVFYCCLFHGLLNVLMAAFILSVNWIFVSGSLVIVMVSLLIWYFDLRKAAHKNLV